MKLKNKLIILEILKPTKAQLFKNIEVGDVLEISISFKDPGRGRGLYATNVYILNERSKETTNETLSTIMTRLSCFKWQEHSGYITAEPSIVPWND